MADYLIQQEQIAASFSKAAQSYDSAAHLQQQVGEHLLTLWAVKSKNITVLDLGSGSGYLTAQLAERDDVNRVIGLDIAEGMLRFSATHRHSKSINWLCADAQRIPLQDHCIDVVYSSFTLQWCQNLSSVFAEIARILRPGGQCYFATLGVGSLQELESAWRQVDDLVHVNQFISQTELSKLVTKHFIHASIEQKTLSLQYQELIELMKQLKLLGAHNLNSGRRRSLTGPSSITQLTAHYESYRGLNGLLPATYQILYGQLKKSWI